MQSVNITIGGKLEATKEAKKDLSRLRTNETFTDLYAKVKSDIKKLKLQPLCFPRQKTASTIYREKLRLIIQKTIDDYYCTEYFKMLDLSVQQLTDRLIESGV